MRSRAYKLDMGLFNIGPVRFGYSSVIGIIPGYVLLRDSSRIELIHARFGDVADTLLALMLYSRCRQVSCGLGDAGLWMILNIIIDTIVGFIPILGDLADAAFKANTRNVRLLEKRLDEVYKPKELAAQQERMFKEKPHMRKEHQPATNFEDFSDEEDDRRAFIREQDAQDGTRRPEPTAPKNSKGGGRGWFGGDRKPERRPDVEMAQTAPIRPPRTDAGDYQETGTVVSGGR